MGMKDILTWQIDAANFQKDPGLGPGVYASTAVPEALKYRTVTEPTQALGRTDET